MSISKLLIPKIQEIAAAARAEGQTVVIEYQLPSVSINNGEYYFQEHEAEELLDTVPVDLTAEDWILYCAQSW